MWRLPSSVLGIFESLESEQICCHSPDWNKFAKDRGNVEICLHDHDDDDDYDNDNGFVFHVVGWMISLQRGGICKCRLTISLFYLRSLLYEFA